ncbi:class I SAM-dependent methyltransferase [Scytonema sp. NUACC21]
MEDREKQILDSWRINANSWTRVIREKLISSRTLITDAAITKTVIALKPKTFLDVGCGEGWLCYELFSQGINGWGVDVTADLVEVARRSGDNRFLVSSYSDLPSRKFSDITHFSCMICNFSILGQSALEEVAEAGLRLLEDKGSIIIQTLHPLMISGEGSYENGWRETSWQGVGNEAFHPSPWYFRTIESWIEEFHVRGYRLLKLQEPCHPESKKPASIIFVFERIIRGRR